MKIRLIKKSKAAVGGFFTEALNDYLDKKAHARLRPRKKVIRPSEIGYCERMIVMSILNIVEQKAPIPRFQRNFDNGEQVHKRYLLNYLDNLNGINVISVEQSFRDETLWLKGSPDAIIERDETKEKYIFELKSINDRDFQYLSKPLDPHVVQVRVYMHLTGVNKGIVFYENKNTQETKEFEVEADIEELNKIINKCQRIIAYVESYEESKRLPEKCLGRYCVACREKR